MEGKKEKRQSDRKRVNTTVNGRYSLDGERSGVVFKSAPLLIRVSSHHRDLRRLKTFILFTGKNNSLTHRNDSFFTLLIEEV